MDYQIDAVKAAGILRYGADYLEKNGWIQGRAYGFKNAEGGYSSCAIGAMNMAPDSGDPVIHHTANNALRAYTGGQDIPGWNDHPDQTAANVISSLRRAADDLNPTESGVDNA